MALKKFGSHDENNTAAAPRNYLAEVYKLVGVNFPVTLTTDTTGQLIGASYETKWQAGGTEPETNEQGEVTGYTEKFTNEKLTAEQIKKLDAYLAENIKLQS